MNNSGVRSHEELQVLPLDGLWNRLQNIPADRKISEALEYSGCEFHDSDKLFVKDNSVAIVGIGGIAVGSINDSDEKIFQSINDRVDNTKIFMGTAAGLSYLNSGEKDITDLYSSVMNLGHYSVAHTVTVNFLLAGISEGAEVELSLQRDLLHISKVTNTRTRIQNNPPIVVPEGQDITIISNLYAQVQTLTKTLRGSESPDELEYANGFYPINKATLLMISADLSNFRKFITLRYDMGKEREIREIASKMAVQLQYLWPEIFKEKEKPMDETKGEKYMTPKNDYFADRLLVKLDEADPVYAAFEAQDVSRDVGFDFDNFQDVVPRALDEVRETKEAYEEEGPDAKEHFGDEIADIMFSIINLARHAGIRDLPTLKSQIEKVPEFDTKDVDTIKMIDGLGSLIVDASEIALERPEDIEEAAQELFDKGIQDCIILAHNNDFNPEDLLKENVRKYLLRCQAIEQLASDDNKLWDDLARNNEIVTYWKKAKTILKP